MENELYHHGVKGMRWGVRKKRETTSYEKVSSKKKRMDDAQATLASLKVKKKQAAKEWNRSYNDLNNVYRNWGPSGKSVRNKASQTASASIQADKSYKQAKKNYKQAKKDYKRELGKDNENYTKEQSKKDRFFLSEGANRQVNRLLNTHGDMTVSQARKQTYIEAGANTIAVVLAAYGAYKLSGN